MERKLKAALGVEGFGDVEPRVAARMMANVGKGNRTTELRLRGLLGQNGVRGWTTRAGSLPGRPDFVFTADRVAVFCDGCFWHGCPQCGHVPRRNSRFWRIKILRNRERDVSNTRALRVLGYKVVRLWEHEIKDGPRVLRAIRRMLCR